MTKKEHKLYFKKTMSIIQKILDINKKLDKIVNTLSKYESCYSDLTDDVLCSYFELSSQILVGKEYIDEKDVFFWYVYENDMGEKGLSWIINDETFTINNEKDLYKLILKLKCK